jgi:hypothetical protein
MMSRVSIWTAEGCRINNITMMHPIQYSTIMLYEMIADGTATGCSVVRKNLFTVYQLY